MVDFLLIGIIVLIVDIAGTYILKAKKSGVKCIGCPAAGKCCGKKEGHTVCDCKCHE